MDKMNGKIHSLNLIVVPHFKGVSVPQALNKAIDAYTFD